ncbi:molybdopterin molybdotransferase MoeA [Nesterenkonia lutea]|uniref:Molybdopterin molybdenumtransferase n=1 Tax=Nesterenkonia lutea TaxID=272919 RepID=A0ABR9JAG4_9MICC|nr:molybdopterin molybdotransferase MoeA [Nesterenkonia lutea]MBE1522924.1 molybdopterin molybdotransferase [Nesterenkonia lutea]
MMALEQARREISALSALATAVLPVEEALGHVLAAPILAQQDIPHVATSAMDGWALAAPPESGPGVPSWELRAETAHSPVRQAAPLGAGEAAEVVTGSPVPDGTVSVLRTEHGIISGRTLTPARTSGDLAEGRNVRAAGTECPAGTQLLPSGAVLTPARAAVAAVAGHDRLEVVRRPRVVLILTGEEVITTGIPRGGQVRDVFGIALPGMVTEMGAGTVESLRLGDDPEMLSRELRRITEAGEADLVITSGGTAHSRADSLRPALHALGAEILVDSVDMRPGHPALFARLSGAAGTVHLLGLPGNPLAGFAALAALGAPLFDALGGVPADQRSRALSLTAGAPLQGAARGVRLVPVRSGPSGAVPAGHSSPHMMRGLADSDALAIVPQDGVVQGEQVQCLEIPGQRRGGHRWDE